jgi:hypothetical protein
MSFPPNGRHVKKVLNYFAGGVYGMSFGFLMPMICFAFVGVYGYMWSRLSKVDNEINLSAVKGH